MEPARNQPPAPERLLACEAAARAGWFTPYYPLNTPGAFVDFTPGQVRVRHTPPPSAPAATLHPWGALGVALGAVLGVAAVSNPMPLLVVVSLALVIVGLAMVSGVLGGVSGGPRAPEAQHALPDEHGDALWALLAADQRGGEWDLRVTSRLLPGLLANPNLRSPRTYRAAVALALEAEFHPQREQFLVAAEEVTRIRVHDVELLDAAGQQMEQAHIALLNAFRLAHAQRSYALGSRGLPAFDELNRALADDADAGQAALAELTDGPPQRDAGRRRRSRSTPQPPTA